MFVFLPLFACPLFCGSLSLLIELFVFLFTLFDSILNSILKNELFLVFFFSFYLWTNRTLMSSVLFSFFLSYLSLFHSQSISPVPLLSFSPIFLSPSLTLLDFFFSGCLCTVKTNQLGFQSTKKQQKLF